MMVAVGLALFASRAAAQDKINYTDHVRPIFQANCFSCHNADDQKAGLDLTSMLATMTGSSGGEVILPGDPAESRLYKVMAHIEQPAMPPRQPKLPDAQLEMIKKWIEGGALETADGKPQVSKGPKLSLALASTGSNKPDGPPPMPEDLLIEPVVVTQKPGVIRDIAAHPWSPVVAIAGQKQVLLYNTDSQRLLGVLAMPTGFPEHVGFSRNGQLVFASGGIGGQTGQVTIWQLSSGAQLASVGESFDAILSADVSPDQRMIVTGDPSRLVKVYSLADGSMKHRIKKHTDWVTAVAYSPDGVLLATADRAGNLHIWEAESLAPFYTLEGHKAAITDMSWRSDSNVLATSDEDGQVMLWDMNSGSRAKNWAAHNGGTLSVAFAQNGQLVTAGRDRQVKHWDQAGKQLRAFESLSDVAVDGDLTYDGSKVIGAGWAGEIYIWNAADGKRIGDLHANPPTIATGLAKATQLRDEVKAVHIRQSEAATQAQQAMDAAAGKLNVARDMLGKSEAARLATSAQLTGAEQAAAQIRAMLEQTKAQLAERQAVAAKATESAKATQEQAQKTIAELKGDPNTDPAMLNAIEAAATAARQLAEQTQQAVTATEQSLTGQGEALAKLQAQLVEAKSAIDKAAMQGDAQKALLATREKVLADSQQSHAAAQQALADATARLAAAEVELAWWQAAQVNVQLYAARDTVAVEQDAYAPLAETAAASQAEADRRLAAVARVEAELAEAPQRIENLKRLLAESQDTLKQREATVVATVAAIDKKSTVLGQYEQLLAATTKPSEPAPTPEAPEAATPETQAAPEATTAAPAPAEVDTALSEAAAKAREARDILAKDLEATKDALEDRKMDVEDAQFDVESSADSVKRAEARMAALPAEIAGLKDEAAAAVKLASEHKGLADAAAAKVAAAESTVVALNGQYQSLKARAATSD
jgi:WD40 repeat protein/chromosome segregation ATPase